MKKHTWISNRAFAAISGATAVCLDCGDVKIKGVKPRECPGEKAAPKEAR